MELENERTLRGLPEGSTWADVNSYDNNLALEKERTLRGLPEGSTWADVNSYDSKKEKRHQIMN